MVFQHRSGRHLQVFRMGSECNDGFGKEIDGGLANGQ